MPSTQTDCQEKAVPLWRTRWNIYKLQPKTVPGRQPECEAVATSLSFRLFMKCNKTEKEENFSNRRCPSDAFLETVQYTQMGFYLVIRFFPKGSRDVFGI